MVDRCLHVTRAASRHMFGVVLACLATMLVVTTARAQERVPTAGATGTISGRITEALKETPVVGATVRVLGQESATESDSSGRFTLRGVRVGIVTIEVR